MPNPADNRRNDPRPPDAVSPDDSGFDDALATIDWAELQEFFLNHLRDQLTEMQALFRKGDTAGLARIGHNLKGSGGGVQLPRFTELGRALESAGKAGDLIGARTACVAIRVEYLAYRPEDEERFGTLFEI